MTPENSLKLHYINVRQQCITLYIRPTLSDVGLEQRVAGKDSEWFGQRVWSVAQTKIELRRWSLTHLDLLLLRASTWAARSFRSSWCRLRRLASEDSCWTVSSSKSFLSFSTSCSRRRCSSPYHKQTSLNHDGSIQPINTSINFTWHPQMQILPVHFKCYCICCWWK